MLPSEAVAEAVTHAAAFVAAGGASTVEPGGLVGASDVRGGDVGEVTIAADPAQAVQHMLQRVRAAGGRVVATGGCFDLLHAGHIGLLEAARSLGDALVVLINSDDSVRRLKGAGRPLQTQADRARILAALRCVDGVVAFAEDTPEQALAELRPDLWVKGGDYAGQELPEAGLVRSWGGQIVSVPYLAGRSTSDLVEQARR
jgi:rfaE bifunctional protein nucleotidyltransferase chain/domain